MPVHASIIPKPSSGLYFSSWFPYLPLKFFLPAVTQATIDAILNIARFGTQLKSLFGFKGLEHDEDFVSLLEVRLQKSTPLPF
jgi:hypothetical protein